MVTFSIIPFHFCIPAYYSYTEVPLKCRSYASGRTYNLLQAAHVSSAGVELARDLNMKVGDMALFGLFAESSPDAPDQPTSNMAMCIFTLKKITKKVREGVQNCFFGYGHQGLSQFSDNLSCSYSTVSTCFIMRSVMLNHLCDTGNDQVFS